jgi:hypothetical protein
VPLDCILCAAAVTPADAGTASAALVAAIPIVPAIIVTIFDGSFITHLLIANGDIDNSSFAQLLTPKLFSTFIFHVLRCRQ